MFHEHCLECCFIACPQDVEVVTVWYALNDLGFLKTIDVPSKQLSFYFTGCACVLNYGVEGDNLFS